MNGYAQTLTVSVLTPDMLRMAQESSEILKQYLKENGSASLKLAGAEG